MNGQCPYVVNRLHTKAGAEEVMDLASTAEAIIQGITGIHILSIELFFEEFWFMLDA